MSKEKSYSWDAKEYEKHSTAQQIWARELIRKLQLKGDESLLDIGCGDGKVTAEIAALLPLGQVLGVDSSEDMIALARKKIPADQYANLSFALHDARRLNFIEQFDIVFSNAALHWVKDHKPVIVGIEKGLKAKGRILLQMGGQGNAEAIISLLHTIMQEKEWGGYFTDFEFPYGFYAPDVYLKCLQEAGLSPKRLELLPKDMSYPDKSGLAGWIRTTWLPYLNRLPASLQEKFITELVERYIEKYPPDGDGFVHVAMVRLEVEAEKNEVRT